MLKTWLFLCLAFSQITLYAAQCRDSTTTKAPAHISSVLNKTEDTFLLGNSKVKVSSDTKFNKQEHILTEEVLSDDPNKRWSFFFTQNARLLKRGTIVKLTQTVGKAKKDDYVKITVLSENNNDLNKILEGDTKVILQNEEGYVPYGSLNKLDHSTVLILKRKTKMLKFNSNQVVSLKPGTGLRPIESMGRYKVKICANKIYYVYKAINVSNNQVDEVLLERDKLACYDMNSLSHNAYEKVAKLYQFIEHELNPEITFEDLQYNEWGHVNLPLEINNPNTKNIVGRAKDKSYVHFKGGDPLNSDTWGHPDSICEFMRISKEWKRYCIENLNLPSDRCTLQVGDISWITPARKDNKRDPLGHKHHHDGTCFDIRPLRTDNQFIGTTIHKDKKGYDRELNHKLISFLLERQSSPLYFSDKNITNDLGATNRSCNISHPENDIGMGALYCDGHFNHIHFCLKPERVRGCQ